MNIKKHIPNSLTLLNLFCGSVAVLFTILGSIEFAFFAIGVGLVADFLDGLVARALGVSSPIGAQLDSLADMVSFGLFPGVLMLVMLDGPDGIWFDGGVTVTLGYRPHILGTFGLLITLFSALRLAKFNVDETQSEEFKGLATPAATIWVIGIYFLHQSYDFITKPVLIIATIAISLLLISNIPMFSFKLKSFKWKDASWQYVFIILAVVSAIIFKFAAIAIIITLYIILNIIRYFVNKPKNVQS